MSTAINTNKIIESLKTRAIVDILIGDKDFESSKDKNIKLKMPYKTGSNLLDICHTFGIMTEEQTRHRILEDIFTKIEFSKLSDLLSFFFLKKHFSEILKDVPSIKVNEEYNQIKLSAISSINTNLFFSDLFLEEINNSFIIHGINDKVSIVTDQIKIIDTNYINKKRKSAFERLEEKEYDSVITISRTLLEETLIYLLEKKNIAFKKNGKILDLFKKVQDNYNIYGNGDKDICLLVDSLFNIIKSIGIYRNKQSDAHGQGENRKKIPEHWAKLVLNTSLTICEFLIGILNYSKNK